MPKLHQQIATLEDKLKILKLRQQRSEARQRAIVAQRERKLETRRRILVGGVVLAKVKDGSLAQSDLKRWLDAALTHPNDRALFGLAEPRGPKPDGGHPR